MSATAIILAAYFLARWTDRAVDDYGIPHEVIVLGGIASHFLFGVGVLVAFGIIE